MKSSKHQCGMSLIVLIVIIGLFGYAVYIGIKITPEYLEFHSIRSSVDSLGDEMKSRNISKNQYLDLLSRRLNINYVDMYSLKPSRDGCVKGKNEVFSYKREKKAIVLGVNYEKRIPMLVNIDFLLSFNHTKSVAINNNNNN